MGVKFLVAGLYVDYRREKIILQSLIITENTLSVYLYRTWENLDFDAMIKTVNSCCVLKKLKRIYYDKYALSSKIYKKLDDRFRPIAMNHHKRCDMVETVKFWASVISCRRDLPFYDQRIFLYPCKNSQASVDLAIQSSKTQSTMKNQGYATIVLSVVIIVLTIALLQSTGNLLEYTSTQFQIENFESEFMINNPHIVLREWHSFDQFDYLTPIEINSLTSHNYRLTAYPIVDSFELQSFGECFLGSAPEIVMIEPSIFFVDSGANDRTIEPTFRLGFEKFPYSNQINKENSVYHSVGKIQFEIVAQNLQIPSDTRVFQKNVGVSIPYPSDAADRLCKK